MPSGGKRKGAGRKPNYVKRIGVAPITAAKLLALVDEEKFILNLLHDRSADVRLRTWTTLREHRDGKPRQAFLGAMAHIGGAGSAGRADLDELSDAELDAKLAEMMKELGVTKTGNAPAPLLLEAETTPAPAETPAPKLVWDAPATPAPYQKVERTSPPAAAGQNSCDLHGSFRATSPYDVCPRCKLEWAQDTAADEQKLSGLMPGEPLWSRR